MLGKDDLTKSAKQGERLSVARSGSQWTTLFGPVLWPWRMARPFWKWRAPFEPLPRRALLIGSGPRGTVLKIVDDLISRFPKAHFTALVHEDIGGELQTRYPQIEVEAIDLDTYPGSRLSLLIGLWKRDLDLSVTVLSGTPGFRADKIIGFLSGARYLMTYNSHLESVYWGLGRTGDLARYLKWRLRLNDLDFDLRQRPSHSSKPGYLSRLSDLLRLGYLLIVMAIGYLVVFASILPLLLHAALHRKAPSDQLSRGAKD